MQTRRRVGGGSPHPERGYKKANPLYLRKPCQIPGLPGLYPAGTYEVKILQTRRGWRAAAPPERDYKGVKPPISIENVPDTWFAWALSCRNIQGEDFVDQARGWEAAAPPERKFKGAESPKQPRNVLIYYA